MEARRIVIFVLASASCADVAHAPRDVVAAPPLRAKAPEFVATPPARPAPSIAAAAAAPEPPKEQRLTSVGYFTWIYRTPKVDDRFIGYVRFGQSVALKSADVVRGQGCGRGFYAIEPRGYVCRDRTVTLEPDARFEAAARAVAPAPGAFPFHYGLSNGAPMYGRLPTPREQVKAEWVYGKASRWIHLPKTLAAHEELARAEAIPAADEAPAFALDGAPLVPERLDLVRQSIPVGSMLSFSRSFSANGRTWLLSPDMTYVPADRVRPFAPSSFKGTRLDAGVSLPLAWIKATPRHKVLVQGGVATISSATWPVRSFVGLTGASVDAGGKRYLETRERQGDDRVYVAEKEVTVTALADRLPFGVSPDDSWVTVSISKGTLVAYEGMTPVYATLVSPGKGGVPMKGVDNVGASTTPLGAFRITFKDRAATMSPDKGEDKTFWIADVPFTQYFAPPFALHAAYWHERFGDPTSAGCINLSPLDAEALFDWTGPKVPDGWAGATGAGATKVNGRASFVVVRR